MMKILFVSIQNYAANKIKKPQYWTIKRRLKTETVSGYLYCFFLWMLLILKSPPTSVCFIS